MSFKDYLSGVNEQVIQPFNSKESAEMINLNRDQKYGDTVLDNKGSKIKNSVFIKGESDGFVCTLFSSGLNYLTKVTRNGPYTILLDKDTVKKLKEPLF